MKLIRNALISTGKLDETRKVNIKFDDKIIEITEQESDDNIKNVIDLNGKLLIPGCLDPHVHFNDPGFTEREDFQSGTTAAAVGGITTIIDMPCTSIPPVTSAENLRKKLEIVSPKAMIDFAFWGGIRKNDFSDFRKNIPELRDEGVVGFKIYTISGMESFGALSYQQIEQIISGNYDVLFAFHAEDENIIKKAAEKLTTNELRSLDNYVSSRPVESEVRAVKKIIEITDRSKIHFVHISSKEAAELILNSEKNISFETCPHYLQFTSDDFKKLRGKLKTAPPVKFREDRSFLRKMLKSGKIDFISTDHAGCNYEKLKLYSDFSKIYNGIPGSELMIPYLFSEFYQKERVSLETMINITSKRAAQRLNLYPQKGSLHIGTDADFTVIDLNQNFRVDENKLHSKGKYSPFNNVLFTCSVDRTIVRGREVYNKENGLCSEAGYGKFIKANS